jgi:serine/threonine-protein kinase
MADLVGATLGQYKILKLFGRGEIANVYKAWQPSLRRHAALIVLNPPFSCVADFVQGFQDEATSAADLKHANIATIHDVGTENGHHYVAIEFIAASSLQERICSRGPVSLEETGDILCFETERL